MWYYINTYLWDRLFAYQASPLLLGRMRNSLSFYIEVNYVIIESKQEIFLSIS